MTYPLPVSLLATFAAAEGSHRLIERPFLQWRSRFLRKRRDDAPVGEAGPRTREAAPLA